jgi:hypothetical protein
LKKVFKPNEISGNAADEEIKRLLEEPLQLSLPTKLFTTKEIRKIIQEELHARKAPGYDLISGNVLDEVPKKGTVHLLAICSATVR